MTRHRPPADAHSRGPGRLSRLDEAERLGQLLVRKRMERGWTQRAFATKLGKPPATVSAWETGRSLPELPSLLRLGAVFEMDPGRLLAEAGLEARAAGVPSRLAETKIPLYRWDSLRLEAPFRVVGEVVGEIPRSPDNKDPHSYGVVVPTAEGYPRVWPGDVLEVTTSGEIQDGATVLIFDLRDPGRRWIRRLKRHGRRSLICEPINPSDQLFEIEVGRVRVHPVLSIRPRTTRS